MNPLWRKYFSQRAPRYTSYPSALLFDSSVTPAAYTAKLSKIGLYQPLSLYFHVPFCRRQCWYCGCNMRVENNYERALSYVDALRGEIRLVARGLGGRGRPQTIHFGGGTPNYLSADDLAGVIETVELELGLTDQTRLAIEIDPRELKTGDVRRLVGLGFSRISIGVQDFDPEVQAAINRIQPFELVEAAVADMRTAGVADISFDLLYGLPKQTLSSFKESIEKAIALGPDRLSVFGYAHLPQSIKRQRLIREEDLPGGETRVDLAEAADAMLIGAGYARVGFDHYARPGNSLANAAARRQLRRNFQGFTDDAAEASIGFGASAISHVNGLYAQNAKAIDIYKNQVRSGILPIERGVERTLRDEAIAHTIEEFLCTTETDIGPVLAGASAKEAEAIRQSLGELAEDGVIEWRAGHIRLADGAGLLARVAASALDPLEARNRVEAGRFSCAV
ncbi:MAG: oxygen-independent coproporphyrinogen III oxidase [Parvularculaceae bacterium]